MRFAPRFKQRKSGLWMFDDKPPSEAFGYRVAGFGAYNRSGPSGDDVTSWKFLASSSQFLSAPDHANFSLWDSDWTVDYWINHITINGADRGHWSWWADNSNRVTVASPGSGELTDLRVSGETSGGVRWSYDATSTGLTTSTWQHMAHELSGGTVYTYVDGVDKGNGAKSGSIGDLAATFFIGKRLGVGGFLDAYIDEFRISNTARYGGSGFTPETTPYAVDANTIVLIHCGETVDGGTFTDTAGTHEWTLNNTPTQDTGTYKF